MTTLSYRLARSARGIQPRQRNAATVKAGARRRLADSLIVRMIASCAFAASLLALVHGALQLTIAL